MSLYTMFFGKPELPKHLLDASSVPDTPREIEGVWITYNYAGHWFTLGSRKLCADAVGLKLDVLCPPKVAFERAYRLLETGNV